MFQTGDRTENKDAGSSSSDVRRPEFFVILAGDLDVGKPRATSNPVSE